MTKKTTMKTMMSALLVSGVVLGAGAPAVSAQADNKNIFRLDKGHSDIFNVQASDKKALELNLKEDVTSLHNIRKPEDVLLVVKKEAYEPRTKNIPAFGNKATYLLPLTQNHKLLWPGWDTQGASPHFKHINIDFVDVCGPGHIYMATQGDFGGFKPLLNNDGYEVKKGAFIPQTFPGHVHTNWGFERPGTYKMKVQATSQDPETKAVKSRVATYTWQVEGNAADADAAKPVEGVTSCDTWDPKPSDTPKPSDMPKPSDAPKPNPSNTPKPSDTAKPTPAAPEEPGMSGPSFLHPLLKLLESLFKPLKSLFENLFKTS